MARSLTTRLLIPAFAGLALVSCSSTASTKPDVPSPVSSAAPVKAPGNKTDQPGRQQIPSSSLDAHREGKTPASGPLTEIYFDFDSSDLRADARRTLQTNAAWLKANPSARVEIEGHCDDRGTTEYNLALGAKRARAARDYLLTLGIVPARISTISYGEELLACKDRTEQCYQKNRRDRFVIVATRPASMGAR